MAIVIIGIMFLAFLVISLHGYRKRADMEQKERTEVGKNNINTGRIFAYLGGIILFVSLPFVIDVIKNERFEGLGGYYAIFLPLIGFIMTSLGIAAIVKGKRDIKQGEEVSEEKRRR